MEAVSGIRIFEFAGNDEDRVAAETAEAAREYMVSTWAPLSAEVSQIFSAADLPRELSDAEADTLAFRWCGEVEADRRSFRAELQRRVANGETFPQEF